MFAKLVVVLAAVIVAGCGSNKELKEDNPSSLAVEPVQIVGIGRIEPESKILEITSRTLGIVTQILFQAGDRIEKGQTILELDSAVEKARLEQAAARIQTQLSQIEAAKALLEANSRLTGRNLNHFLRIQKGLKPKLKPPKNLSDNTVPIKCWLRPSMK